ncbi:hypothetical protein [Brucella anthropi]|uniref:hypothetical protein n=1 Tax=Brucella anthropi TaxID=529 RepID=UPI0012BC5727|nr:hypothetical protein [Brucella anthropi]
MPNLEANCSDVGAMVVRSTVGLIPFAGPIISELITHFIPNQRQDRIADYVRRLNEKTERFDRNAFRNTATTTDGIDLFEDGAFQSARATSDERREYIANVVAYGLSGEQKERIEAKRILNILSQIDDQQIIILASQHEKYLFDDDFRDRHENILTPPFAHFQSDEDEIAQEAMYDVALDQLFKLGLLKRQFKAPRSTSDLSFDPKTGMLKSTGKSISAMGRLILRRIGLTEDENEPG